MEAARADFEILSREVYGKPLVYLDSGASAQKPRAGAGCDDAISPTSEYANVHRGVHFLSAAATDRYEAARETVRKFLNAARDDEIVFTKGGTEAINLVSYSYLAPRIQPGDEIVLTVMEHHSNIVPWHFLRERQGAVLQMGRCARRRLARHRSAGRRHQGQDQAGRRHPYVECAGHGDAAEGDRRPRPCQGRAGAGRWLPGRGA